MKAGINEARSFEFISFAKLFTPLRHRMLHHILYNNLNNINIFYVEIR